MSSPAQIAAHRALWSGVHGNKRLPKTQVVDKAVEYYESRGEAVSVLQLDPDRENLDLWRAEWNATFIDMGVESPADILKAIGWLESRSGLRGSAATVTGSTNLARMALEAFESVGASVPPEGILALDRAIAVKDAGEVASQCTCVDTIGALYLGKSKLEPESIAWIERSKASIDVDGTIDLCVMAEYAKQMKQTTSNMAERAFKTAVGTEKWYASTAALLDSMGLPKATHRLHRVVAQCRAQSHGDDAMFRAFLHGYFFVDFLGRGMPSVLATASALVVIADPRKGMSMRLPSANTDYDMALSGFSLTSRLSPPWGAARESLP